VSSEEPEKLARLEVPEARIVSSPTQRRALAIFALAAVVALAWLALPISSGLFLGTLLAFTLLRVYERLSLA
jgi:predicted PurR-regulated permease PerM